ncbi:hypothetical protein V2G26_001407 [Clonostachys chloroleuca]|uniref:Zn(2)-C6 fungal-type domain-containing protein n=1 Tax=Clonostachys chloroleuca TaxID=1926264 RepID=A0AA35LQX5_9HYPO|nr:unnamed protein product [Clonostachys chloroleuca]
MEDEQLSGSTPPPKIRKKRIPKACGSCRQSKVKCDGQRPCSRCRSLKKVCVFTEPPKDEQERKIENLEKELDSLRAQIQVYQQTIEVQHDTAFSIPGPSSAPPMDVPVPQMQPPGGSLLASSGAFSTTRSPVEFNRSQLQQNNSSPSTTFQSCGTSTGKRKRSHFEIEPIVAPDFASMGLISMEEAESYFATFFQGCDQYVPVFDPRFDSMHGIRSRSGLLFSSICAAGCRILKGTDSNAWHLLNFHIKRVLNAVLATPAKATLETVQALLVRACFASERSLLVTLGIRLAIDLGLPEAYEELSTRFVSRTSWSGVGETPLDTTEDDAILMRKARTWLHLIVLSHMLHVDASDLLTLKFRGAVRRCRVLLESPYSTALDLHLFSQVELNVLRSSTYATLSGCSSLPDEDLMDVIRDAKIDIDVWFNDWMRIVERSHSNKRWLALHLRVQRCWADTMAFCRAVRVSGVENVDAMSPTQRNILLMAKDSLNQHLSIMIEEPREYLHNLKFAMDFVWAKCAFCFLLLLKLSMLLIEDDEEQSRTLVLQGKMLLSELHKAGGTSNGGRSNTSRLYIQLIQTGLEKFSRTVLHENLSHSQTGTSTPSRQRNGSGGSSGGDTSVDSAGHNELESFVPEQFVFEWDFPGLTLFSSPTTEAGWLDDFLRGSLIGGEDLYGLRWSSIDVGPEY